MKQDEQILVVKREKLFVDGLVVHGIIPMSNFDTHMSRIAEHKEFLWRSAMELDPVYKQIIPYMIFTYENKFFLMKRRHDGNAKELRNKFTLGIGGHLRKEDLEREAIINNNATIADWGKREFEEEIHYTGTIKAQPLGLVNDEESLIGKVHAGFVFVVQGDSPHISIKSELKEGSLLSLDECMEYYENMELWSKFVINYLIQTQSNRSIQHVQAAK